MMTPSDDAAAIDAFVLAVAADMRRRGCTFRVRVSRELLFTHRAIGLLHSNDLTYVMQSVSLEVILDAASTEALASHLAERLCDWHNVRPYMLEYGPFPQEIAGSLAAANIAAVQAFRVAGEILIEQFAHSVEEARGLAARLRQWWMRHRGAMQ